TRPGEVIASPWRQRGWGATPPTPPPFRENARFRLAGEGGASLELAAAGRHPAGALALAGVPARPESRAPAREGLSCGAGRPPRRPAPPPPQTPFALCVCAPGGSRR